MSYPPDSDSTLQNIDHPPLPQPGYPTQQAYTPQYSGYSPDQAFHPTQECVLPQSLTEVKDGPPAYNQVYLPAATPVVQQQASTNAAVVQEQPTPTVHTNTVRPFSDNYLILSVVLTIFCFITFAYHGLFCTIPALIFAIIAQFAKQRGDLAAYKIHSRISLGLNIAAIVFYIVILLVTIISISAAVSGGNDGSSNSYRYRYS